MGTRVVEVTPEALVNFLKPHADRQVVYEISDPLPPDTTLKAVAVNEHRLTVLLTLESDHWEGDSPDPIFGPTVTVRYLEVSEP